MIFFCKYFLIESAASLPSLIAHTTNDAPLIISPAAKTPGIFVSIVLKSVLSVPHLVTDKSGQLNSWGRFSGSKPSALTTKSVFISNSVPETISGFFLPVSSGFPSSILSAINFST